MKFVKEFPWVDVSEEEKKSVKDLYRDTCDLIKIGYDKAAAKVKERYPTYKEKTKDVLKKGYDYSKDKGQELYNKCHDEAPGYFEMFKIKCSSFLRKIKDKFSHRS